MQKAVAVQKPKVALPRKIEATSITNPHWAWNRAIPQPGHMGVDFEGRVDFAGCAPIASPAPGSARQFRLRRSAPLRRQQHPLRHRHQDRRVGARQALPLRAACARDQEPVVWDFGSAAVHHRLYCDWLQPDHVRAGMLGMRGTVPPAGRLMKRHAEEIMSLLNEAGVGKMPVGVDLAETAMFFELEKAGMKVVDGQQVMLDAREIKNIDEIVLLNQAAAMVDAHLSHDLRGAEARRPRERHRRQGATSFSTSSAPTTSRRSTPSPASAATRTRTISPTASSGRATRPSSTSSSPIMGYRTCYYRTFNVGRATPAQHDAYSNAATGSTRAIELIKPGVSTDTVASVWPEAEEFGFPDEMSAFGLQFGHGLGLAIHERPIISRLVSLENPMEIKTGMVFALETYCPATDGYSAARIEEEVVVTDKGCQVISLFPAEELPIANRY